MAALTSDETGLLFLLLAFVAFGVGIFCAFTNRLAAAAVSCAIGLVILLAAD